MDCVHMLKSWLLWHNIKIWDFWGGSNYGNHSGPRKSGPWEHLHFLSDKWRNDSEDPHQGFSVWALWPEKSSPQSGEKCVSEFTGHFVLSRLRSVLREGGSFGLQGELDCQWRELAPKNSWRKHWRWDPEVCRIMKCKATEILETANTKEKQPTNPKPKE